MSGSGGRRFLLLLTNAAHGAGTAELLGSEHPVCNPEDPVLLRCGLDCDGAQRTWRPRAVHSAYEPYQVYTQDNVLSEQTEAVLPQSVIMRQGITLDQLAALLRTFAIRAEVHHAADSRVEDFRSIASRALAAKGHYVLVNYLRRTLGEERGGHISPLAAYDAETDRFLILDVARYKYPPVWATAADLFAAMNTPDADNGNRTRGFVVISNEQ